MFDHGESMRIAMIGHKRVPGREGGVEVVVEELATRMAAKGHSVTVYNRYKKGFVVPEEYKGVHIVTIPTIATKSMDAFIYSFFASIAALFGNYDVIHYHALGPSTMLIIPHLFHKKVVVTVHGLNYKTPKWRGIGARYIRLGEKIVAKYADEIIVLSKEQQKYFIDNYHRETNYIPNGVIAPVYRNADFIIRRFGLRRRDYILFVSRVVPGKGIEYLINAFKQVKTNLKLIIAGDSEYVPDYRMRIMRMASNDSRIKFIGFANCEELQELYSNAAMFIFPSEAEGMPMSLLEALSYGLPCLVSDIPENIEVGKNYVWTFRSKDSADLAEKLRMMLTKLNEFDQQAIRQYIHDTYDWNFVVDRTLEIYENN